MTSQPTSLIVSNLSLTSLTNNPFPNPPSVFQVLLLGFIATVAVLLQIYSPGDDNLEVVLDLTGGIAGSAISFLLPGFIGLALVPSPDAEKTMDEEEKDFNESTALISDHNRLDDG